MDSSIKLQSPNMNKFKTDVWQKVPFDAGLNSSPRNNFPLNDYKTISFRIAANSAEKKRRSGIMQDLQRKQCEMNTKLEDRLQAIRSNTTKECQERLKMKKQETDEMLSHIINNIEQSCRIENEVSKSELNKIQEHNTRLVARAKELKTEENRGLIDAFNSTKANYINLFDRFVTTITMNHSILHALDKYTTFIDKSNGFIKSYETLANGITARKLGSNDVKTFQQICNDIDLEQKKLEADLKKYEKIIENANNYRNEIARKGTEQTDGGVIPNEKQEPPPPPAPATATVTNATTNSTPKSTPNKSVSSDSASIIISPERLECYKELLIFYEEYMMVIRPLLNNTQLKQFMFNCKKAVNTPVNAIGARSREELQDKFNKLYRLLNGTDPNVPVGQIPGGIEYCTWLLAKKFVDQASSATGSYNAQTIYAVAAIIVAIWQHFPDFGKLFLMLLYKECPFLVPLLIPPRPDQDEQSYLVSIGYRIKENVMEDETAFLKRIASIQHLRCAILITQLSRNRKNDEHPHSIENGWIWLTNFLNLEPLPTISSTMLLEFIQVCGREMINVYKTQFKKILIIIHLQYVPKLNAIEKGGPKARLEALLNNFMKENSLPAPPGQLADNFW